MRFNTAIGQCGFTLVEMMVVMAIVSGLSAVALPQYQKFLSHARTAEAKIALGLMSSTEMEFYVESGTYTACLAQIGYSPEPAKKRYYFTGFKNAPDGHDCGPQGNYTCFGFTFAANPLDPECRFDYPGFAWEGGVRNDCTYDATISVNPAALTSTDAINLSFGVDQNHFHLGAWGSISSSDTLDAWSMDEKKNLIHSRSGI